ncbi:hypothetical protein Tco_1229541 [Tanacetum coccineum]
MKSHQLTNAFVKETFMDLKTQLETVAKKHQALIQNLETKFDRLADKQSGRPSGSLPSNTQPNPQAMAEDENSEFESDTKEPPFEKIIINTDYKIQTSLDNFLLRILTQNLFMKNLEYVFLEEPSFLPVIISSQLSAQNKGKLISVLKNTRKLLPGKQLTFLVSAHHSTSTRYNF